MGVWITGYSPLDHDSQYERELTFDLAVSGTVRIEPASRVKRLDSGSRPTTRNDGNLEDAVLRT